MKKIFIICTVILLLLSCSEKNSNEVSDGVYFFESIESKQQNYGYLEINNDSVYSFDIFNRFFLKKSINDYDIINHNDIFLKDSSNNVMLKLFKIEYFKNNDIDITKDSWYTYKLGNLTDLDSAWFDFNEYEYDFVCKYKDEKELSKEHVQYQQTILGKNMFIIKVPLMDEYFLVDRHIDTLTFYSYKKKNVNSFKLTKIKEINKNMSDTIFIKNK